MEQTANETTQCAPEMQKIEAARKDIDALRRDIETLRADLRSLYQSAKGAGKLTLDDAKSRVQETAKNVESWAVGMLGSAQDQTQKWIEISRGQICKRPFATVVSAVMVGMIVGRLRTRKQA